MLVFDGTNHAFWKVMMEVFLISPRVDVWTSVQVDYNVSDIHPIDAGGKIIWE